jgi:hypothetical protein
VLPELIEAATRSGRKELARDALEQLSEMTRAAGTDWALGLEARSRALVSEPDMAEPLFRRAIELLGRTRVRGDFARAHLLFGECLRSAGRRTDAREHLRTAHRMFTEMGAEAFAERARRELVATGGTVRKRRAETRDGLTAQEWQIARLAGDGCRTRRSARGFSSAPAPSSGTSARSSRSSGSGPGAGSSMRCPPRTPS